MSHNLFVASRELETEMIGNLSQYMKLYKELAKKTICVKPATNALK